MTQRESEPTPGLYPMKNVTTHQLDEVKQEVDEIKRLVTKVVERLAVPAD